MRALISAVMFLALCACGERSDFVPRVEGGNAERGKIVLARYECGVCHRIPGVPGAVGQVGPPLDAFALHPHLAGKFPNQPDLLVQWIRDAPSLAPKTAMPAIDMSVEDARDMAAYLYELD
jgi:cytochrome c551/c552